MITRDNGNNYSDLCTKATEILRELDKNVLGKDDSLVDINDYFTVLGNMQQLVEKYPKKVDPYFLILPGIADEEPFKINANTRAIEVPAAFKNGVAVQGDNLAEIIYFSIDRYFDTTDLYYKDAFVQWEAPAQGLGQKDTGLTPCVNKTAKLIPGKVVFGWPIGDSITKQPGTLKFSVRFFDRIQDKNDPTGKKWKLEYSFSTLTSSLKINPGLDFDLSDDVTYNALLEDLSTDVKSLYKNSTFISGADFDALDPIFADYSPVTSKDTNEPIKTIIGYDLDSKELQDGGFSSRALFETNSDVNGIGSLSYNWYKANDIKSNGELINTENTKDLYTLIQETSRNLWDTYYIKNQDGSYSLYTGEIKNGKTNDDNESPLYHKGSWCRPTSAGYYYLQAINTAGRANFGQTDSNRWYIKAAVPIPIDIGDQAHAIFGKNGNGQQIILQPTLGDHDNNDKYVCSWYYQTYPDGEKTLISSANEETYIASEEGNYYLHIENVRNNSVAAISENEIPMRVSHPAEAINTINYLYNGKITSSAKLIDGTSLEVSYIKPTRSDTVEFQWYKVDDSADEARGIIIEGAKEKSFIPTEGGEYFVEVTNKYNEDTVVYNNHNEVASCKKVTIYRG